MILLAMLAIGITMHTNVRNRAGGMAWAFTFKMLPSM